MEKETLFVDLILPLSIPNLYTYRVPFELNEKVKVGQRIVVQFGKQKLYTALLKKVHHSAPVKYQAKYIHSILDKTPIVNELQLAFWDWIAAYYMCSIGEVMNAALPSGLKLSSETKICLNSAMQGKEGEEPEINYEGLNDKEFLIVEALELRNILTLDECAEILEQKTVYPIIKSLLEKQILRIQEDLREKYKPKTQDYLRLKVEYQNEIKLKQVLDTLEKKAGKQLDAMMAFINLSGLHAVSDSKKWVKKSEILKRVESGDSAIKSLVKKNILELKEIETGRLVNESIEDSEQKMLNEIQQGAIEQIEKQFMEKDVVLLHGVTSSGKTEVYINQIRKTIQQGRQVLYLLPEIALTAQIINRLKKVFGSIVGVYHSRFNENERVELWNSVLNDLNPSTERINANPQLSIILGARSALFLPFSNLGLIIVDEEHDTSYKQFDPAPRYNARDSAIFLAQLHKAHTLVGSATPSIESYYNAQSGKYGLVEMLQRFGGALMPEIEVVDIKEARKRKMMKSHFSPQLLDGIERTLNNKEQVILFQNRRGFSPLLECSSCAWTPQCKNCDVSLTYHKAGNQLRCHYCGYAIPVPSRCEACGEGHLKTIGFGTEKIEEEIALFFPSARISRMDLDTTRAKHSHKLIISEFEEQNIDILVGTQMVTKGLDFDHVALVGILNADNSLNFPDFRSFERSYQLMAQVSGRAGRKNRRGKVIIQTCNPGHAIIKDVISNNYLAMYNSQLHDRASFHYPPFYRLIELTVKSRDIDILNEAAAFMAARLREKIGFRVLGPEFPLVARIRNEYLKAMTIKIEKEASLSSVKSTIQEACLDLKLQPVFRQVRVQIDVDPL